jgi:hypothetical protein
MLGIFSNSNLSIKVNFNINQYKTIQHLFCERNKDKIVELII